MSRELQSPPPHTVDLGTDKKVALFGNLRYWESYKTYKTLIWDLEMGSGIGKRRYWEGRLYKDQDCGKRA